MILETTLTRHEAMSKFREQHRITKPVVYLKQLDKRMIYRMGKNDTTRITRLRHHEDSRPMKSVNKRTGIETSKRNEIITFKEKDELYVLEKSGGVSLFDAMSPKLKMGKNDCWYYVPKNVVIPEGILIAKDVEPDAHGHFHYAFQPAYSMKISEFTDKLSEIGTQMRKV
ncbi:hypothetical protein MO867_20580 [Microbulbifer sp. OS29]|uniref:Tse2 ADP-ribosyltransferase toxin domain-containing protein n=1 Tax=Microbulbifer okhotskensis TaxID=2926617 RepID=A0A9X2EQU4_9GAMM|nr:hypothetical protein [Microbulbifer okhotskensis]MCO1336727.1 hypothetical protein [Microbulbifer okhotskensis]